MKKRLRSQRFASNLRRANHLPAEHWLAYRFARRLYALRLEAPALSLGPDGKVMVLLRDDGSSWSLEGFGGSL